MTTVSLRSVKLAAVPLAITLLAGCTWLNPPSEAQTGWELFQKGDFAVAEPHLAKAYAQDPNDPYVELNLGATYIRLGQPEKAKPLLRQVLVTGKDIHPGATTEDKNAGQTLAEIAQANLNLLK